jgi:hypothetical protein
MIDHGCCWFLVQLIWMKGAYTVRTLRKKKSFIVVVVLRKFCMTHSLGGFQSIEFDSITYHVYKGKKKGGGGEAQVGVPTIIELGHVARMVFFWPANISLFCEKTKGEFLIFKTFFFRCKFYVFATKLDMKLVR